LTLFYIKGFEMERYSVDVGNHLKPAGFFNSGYRVEFELAEGVPQEISFRQMRLDGNPFIPVAVFATSPVSIEIQELGGYTFEATPFGVNYPAPVDQTLVVRGVGFVEMMFVDYPIVKTRVSGSYYYY
jgi:hypothetical protein